MGFYANSSSDTGDHLFGEGMDINGNGTPLRHTDKPSKDGNCADSWSSSIGNLDVHYSSGPANDMFVVLVYELVVDLRVREASRSTGQGFPGGTDSQRNRRKNPRTCLTSDSGCSSAAKCPPCGSSSNQRRSVKRSSASRLDGRVMSRG
ncbi:Thermolysin metallopeptidase, alpha-helical domain [Streptomyces sp. DconLS]|nr:Thermolysin metallopeptidase, alpha-helical domain [Streptomyces sp. LamerLS-31b]SCG01368.1 Thermolysin metallopeptidase, alpha-helical domain [Streptomyces sp. DconLS]